MTSFRRGQLIAGSCLAIIGLSLIFVPSRMVFLRYLGIFALLISAVNILLSHLIPSSGSHLGQKLVLFASISIACLVVGVLLLRTELPLGLSFVGLSLLLNWVVIRPLQKRIRNIDAP